MSAAIDSVGQFSTVIPTIPLLRYLLYNGQYNAYTRLSVWTMGRCRIEASGGVAPRSSNAILDTRRKIFTRTGEIFPSKFINSPETNVSSVTPATFILCQIDRYKSMPW
jgi:hypothetical protein